jgi:hypothetical protein
MAGGFGSCHEFHHDFDNSKRQYGASHAPGKWLTMGCVASTRAFRSCISIEPPAQPQYPHPHFQHQAVQSIVPFASPLHSFESGHSLVQHSLLLTFNQIRYPLTIPFPSRASSK